MNDDLTPSEASDPTTSDDATKASADGDASGADGVSVSGDLSADVAAVSALVDGVATPAEHAVVESSPELRKLLATMTANRGHLAPVGAPTTSRESAVTAALAAFDARTPSTFGAVVAAGAGTNTATAPNVVALGPRRGQYRLAMGAAAAAVAVLFVGAAATGLLGRGDDDSSTATQRRSEAPALDLRAAAETVAGGDADAVSPAATDAASAGAASSEAASADAAASDEVIEASVAESFDASERPEPSDATAAPAATIGSIDDGAGVDVDRIDSPAALAVYALDRPRLIASDDGISCITDDAADVELLGTIIYDGTGAVVVRNSTSGVVSARDLATCSVIVSVTP